MLTRPQVTRPRSLSFAQGQAKAKTRPLHGQGKAFTRQGQGQLTARPSKSRTNSSFLPKKNICMTDKEIRQYNQKFLWNIMFTQSFNWHRCSHIKSKLFIGHVTWLTVIRQKHQRFSAGQYPRYFGGSWYQIFMIPVSWRPWYLLISWYLGYRDTFDNTNYEIHSNIVMST